MSELALVNDRLGNFFIATGLMQHLMADGGALPLDEKQLRSIRGYTCNVDIFSFYQVFIPTNIRNFHWMMIVIKIQLKEIRCYDSMSGPGTVYTDKVKDWLVKEMASKKKEVLNISEWKVLTQEKFVPQQGSNPNECGLFTMMCADFLSDYLPM